MTFRIDTKALAGISVAIREMAETFKSEVAIEGAAAMAKVFYDEARLNAESHRKSGLLYSAIYRAYSPERSAEHVQVYRISWNKKKAPHGHLIEFGTSKAPAYPFLRPAAARTAEAIEAGKKALATAYTEKIGKK
jgi:HK97 gp10 family phage protein